VGLTSHPWPVVNETMGPSGLYLGGPDFFPTSDKH
jgi:hypothetical protein